MIRNDRMKNNKNWRSIHQRIKRMRRADKEKKQTEPAPVVRKVIWKQEETVDTSILNNQQPKWKTIPGNQKNDERPHLCNRQSSPLFGQPINKDDLTGLLEHLEKLEKEAQQIQAKAKYWKTGGHGHECPCQICRHSFAGWKMGRDTLDGAYDQLLTKYVMGLEKRKIYDFGLNSYVECYEISKKNLDHKIFTMQANYNHMAQWVKDIRIFQQKPCRWRHPNDVMQIDRIIFDDSGLFTRNPFSEYYIDLNNMKGNSPLMANPTPLIPRMEGTLIVSIRGKSLTENPMANVTKTLMKKIIEPLAINYNIRGNGKLPVFLIYGEEEFGSQSSKRELVNDIFNKMWIFAQAPANIMWIGNGMGIRELSDYDQKAYMEMTYEMTKKSADSMGSISAYNIFVNKPKPNYEPGKGPEVIFNILNDLKEFILTAEPKKLPEWAKPRHPTIRPVVKMIQEINAELRCSKCDVPGHQCKKCPEGN